MADPLSESSDVESYWRPLTEAEEFVASALCRVASSIIRRRVPDVDSRVADGTLDIEVVRYVITEMVKSAVEAPKRPVDAKSVAQTDGPFTVSITYGAAASRVALTDDLLDMLRATADIEIGSLQLGAARIPRVSHSLRGLHHRHGLDWRR